MIFLLALLCGQGPPPQVPPVREYVLSYQEAMVESLRTTKPLVVYVGKEGKNLDCAVVTFKKTLDGYPKECTVVSRPEKDGNVYWVATIPSRASRDDVLAALSKKEVKASTLEPFRQNCST